MAIQVSPGVNVSEFDATTVVPAVSTSVGAMAGLFQWGPGYERVLVDSETTLVQKFGKPTSNNFESFFTAANFLGYGNALYVVRAYDSSTLNAVANNGTITAPQINNYTAFLNTTLAANVVYAAKYPGTLGNSLKVSVCDSPTAFSSNLVANAAVLNFTVGSNIATVNAFNTVSGSANVAANAVLDAITVGDYVRAGNASTGYQFLKVTAKNYPVGAEQNLAGTFYANAVSITFADRFQLPTSINQASNTTLRFWEFYNAVDKAPGTSTYVSNLSLTTQDELHVVVVDANGRVTGTPGQVLEVWSGLSRATDAKTDGGASNYYRQVIDEQSSYIYTGTPRTGALTGLASAIANSTTLVPYSATLALGTDGAGESTGTVSPLAQAYDLFKSKEDVDISLVMQGKAIGTGALANYVIANVIETRKDCVFFVSPDSAIITNNDPAQYAVNFRGSAGGVSGLTYNSSYVVMDSGYKYQYDKYNDTYRWIPLNADIAGVCATTDLQRDAWWSPAGFNRGQIKNVVKLHINPNQAQRDLLYKNDVNPVVTFPGQGTVLYGDKTLLGKPSAFDRINVRRLFIVLEKAISRAAQSSLFEFNDEFTRAQFRSLIEPFLSEVQGRRGIFDYKVVCDETNNTPQVIDSNQFVGDIYIKPARSINFIQLNFVAVRTGVDFNTIVGQF
ncbi:MAG: phage tail sheath subtilisin-like domain-containing protein [Cytophagales bacterium]|nr:phage tail sheath subtilisin-like domain-containing protein [Cytophagales bacterium]